MSPSRVVSVTLPQSPVLKVESAPTNASESLSLCSSFFSGLGGGRLGGRTGSSGRCLVAVVRSLTGGVGLRAGAARAIEVGRRVAWTQRARLTPFLLHSATEANGHGER